MKTDFRTIARRRAQGLSHWRDIIAAGVYIADFIGLLALQKRLAKTVREQWP